MNVNPHCFHSVRGLSARCRAVRPGSPMRMSPARANTRRVQFERSCDPGGHAAPTPRPATIPLRRFYPRAGHEVRDVDAPWGASICALLVGPESLFPHVLARSVVVVTGAVTRRSEPRTRPSNVDRVVCRTLHDAATHPSARARNALPWLGGHLEVGDELVCVPASGCRWHR